MSDSPKKRWFNDGRVLFGIAALTVIVVGSVMSISFWDWLHPDTPEAVSHGETVRNVALVIGAIIAFLFAGWRATVAERQADTSQEQVAAARKQVEAAQAQVQAAQQQGDTAQQAWLNERYHRSASLLSSGTMSVRLGGIYDLQHLADNHPDGYYVQVMRLLCAFVRNPPEDQRVDSTWSGDPEFVAPKLPDDVQAAISVVGHRGQNNVRFRQEFGYQIDLHGANLAGAYLRLHLLDGADLTWANLARADLELANLNGAVLTNANLQNANLDKSSLRSSICRWATFSGSRAHDADFHDAYLEGTIWVGAILDDADFTNTTLTAADFRAAQLNRSIVSGVLLGRGLRPTEDPPFQMLQELSTWLTQAQLDLTVAAINAPPEISPTVMDGDTDQPLLWHEFDSQQRINASPEAADDNDDSGTVITPGSH